MHMFLARYIPSNIPISNAVILTEVHFSHIYQFKAKLYIKKLFLMCFLSIHLVLACSFLNYSLICHKRKDPFLKLISLIIPLICNEWVQ